MGKVGAQALSRNPNWKGGRTTEPRGYVLLKMPGHHLADCRGYVYEHRLKAEEKLDRQLRPGEVVHHEKEVSNNDAVEPLPSAWHHRVRHRKHAKGLRLPGQPNPPVSCACGCGRVLKRFDDQGRPRRFVSGHNSPQRDRLGRFAAAGEPKHG